MDKCGVVTHVEGREVWVEIERTSACSQCHSRSSCINLTGETKEVIKVMTSDAACYGVGDKVKVKVDRGSVRLSIILAYILPLVVVMSMLVISAMVTLSDDVAGVSAVVFLAIYYTVLYLFRSRVEKKMSFKIEK